MKLLTITMVLLFVTGASAASFSNEDVQKTMKNYVNSITAKNNSMPILYKGKLLELKVLKSKKYPDGFHSGVKSKGELYVSCADFIDGKGNQYDIDFLVSKSDNKLVVVQPIVHSINGEKNPYDLDH